MSDSSDKQNKRLDALIAILGGSSAAAQVYGVVYLVTGRDVGVLEAACIMWLGISFLLMAYHTLLTYAFVRRPEKEKKYSIWDNSAIWGYDVGVAIFFLPYVAWFILTLPITASHIRKDSRKDR